MTRLRTDQMAASMVEVVWNRWADQDGVYVILKHRGDQGFLTVSIVILSISLRVITARLK